MSTAVDENASLSDINLFDDNTLIDPWEAYDRLREHAPVYYMTDLNIHVVTRYDLLMQAARDVETFSSQFGDFLRASQMRAFAAAPPEVQKEVSKHDAKMVVQPATLLSADPPVHGKYRSLVDKLFTAGQVRKMEPFVQGIIDDTIDDFIDEGEIDFIDRFAFPIPLKIIADRFGIPEADHPLFFSGATALASGLRATVPSHEEMIRRAKLGVELQQFLIALLEEKRKKPSDDMISLLGEVRLEDEDRPLNHGEVISILQQFLVAGHETTASSFGFGMHLLCLNPGAEDKIRGEKKGIRTFCEETLRIEAPVQGLPRVVTKDTELGGFPLKKGDMIMLRYGAANRDERQFTCPNDLDITRKNAGSQLAFGSGIHHCPGASLARQELNLGFGSLLERAGNFRLAPGHLEPKAEPSFILRNLPHLYVQFDRRS